MSSVFHVKEHVLPCAHIRQYARATSLSQEEELVQHVKQYTPKDNPNPQKGDITVIGAHANGFPKELYEPLWEELYRHLRSKGLRIRTVYIADAAWQGQSGHLNRSKLGNDPSWFDYTHDIHHMINLLRPTPPVIGMGHSFGAAAILNVSLQIPRLFTTLVLLDPVISKYASNPGDLSAGPATASMYRRDVWPDKKTAIEGFGKSAFYKSWDKRVLDRWYQYGIRETESGTGEVELSTTKHQEVFTYLRPSWMAYDSTGAQVVNRDLVPDLDPNIDNTTGKPINLTYPFYRAEPPITLSRLPNVRPSAYYVFGGQSNLSPRFLREEKLELTGSGIGGSGGRKAGRVAGVTNENNSHLIAMEAPDYCAAEAAGWIKKEVDVWAEREKEYEEWTRKSQEEKSTIPEIYKKYAGRPPNRNGKGKEKAKI